MALRTEARPATSDGDLELLDRNVAILALRLLSLAETLSLTRPSDRRGTGTQEVSAALDAFQSVGIGRHVLGAGLVRSATHLATVLASVLTAIEESPMPDQEWEAMTRVLGDELVGKLVGCSISSVQRYGRKERPTPDDVAARLHTVTLLVSDLIGSYNDFGVRRWFQRPRSVLVGQTPAEVLSGKWSPDDQGVQSVRDLARSLLGSPAT